MSVTDYTKQSTNPVDPMPFEVQMAFERAELAANNDWFKKAWPVYSQGMGGHALMSYPVFEWINFRAWLKANPETFATQWLLTLFKR